MISFLEGSVLHLGLKDIIIKTASGVGYSVFPTGSLLAELKVGEEAQIFIYTIVREQEISLYGFASLDERSFFEKLIGVSGIGPKIGIQILSQPIDQFQKAIESADIAFISQTPGIGKKMAQKMILELQGKLELIATETQSQSPAKKEAEEALGALGYDKSTIQEILKQAPEGSSTEDLVKFFLKHA